jgi:hypothetical protein
MRAKRKIDNRIGPIRVNGQNYFATVVLGPLTHPPHDSVLLRPDHEILISSKSPAKDRVRLLCRELATAWMAESGMPHGPLERLEFVETFTSSVVEDVVGLGGKDFIEKLKTNTPGSLRRYRNRQSPRPRK